MLDSRCQKNGLEMRGAQFSPVDNITRVDVASVNITGFMGDVTDDGSTTAIVLDFARWSRLGAVSVDNCHVGLGDWERGVRSVDLVSVVGAEQAMQAESVSITTVSIFAVYNPVPTPTAYGSTNPNQFKTMDVFAVNEIFRFQESDGLSVARDAPFAARMQHLVVDDFMMGLPAFLRYGNFDAAASSSSSSSSPPPAPSPQNFPARYAAALRFRRFRRGETAASTNPNKPRYGNTKIGNLSITRGSAALGMVKPGDNGASHTFGAITQDDRYIEAGHVLIEDIHVVIRGFQSCNIIVLTGITASLTVRRSTFDTVGLGGVSASQLVMVRASDVAGPPTIRSILVEDVAYKARGGAIMNVVSMCFEVHVELLGRFNCLMPAGDTPSNALPGFSMVFRNSTFDLATPPEAVLAQFQPTAISVSDVAFKMIVFDRVQFFFDAPLFRLRYPLFVLLMTATVERFVISDPAAASSSSVKRGDVCSYVNNRVMTPRLAHSVLFLPAALVPQSIMLLFGPPKDPLGGNDNALISSPFCRFTSTMSLPLPKPPTNRTASRTISKNATASQSESLIPPPPYQRPEIAAINDGMQGANMVMSALAAVASPAVSFGVARQQAMMNLVERAKTGNCQGIDETSETVAAADSPTQMAVGDSIGRHYVGAAVGNVLLTASLLAAAEVGGMIWLRFQQSSSWSKPYEIFARCHGGMVLFVSVSLLMCPSLTMALVVVTVSDVPLTQRIVAVIFALVILAVTVYYTVWALFLRERKEKYKKLSQQKRGGDEEQQQNCFQRAYAFWLEGPGEWIMPQTTTATATATTTSSSSSNINNHQKKTTKQDHLDFDAALPHLDGFNKKAPWFSVVEFGVQIGLALAALVTQLVPTKVSCVTYAVMQAVVLSAYLFCCLFFLPFQELFLRIATPIMCACQIIVVIVVAALAADGLPSWLDSIIILVMSLETVMVLLTVVGALSPLLGKGLKVFRQWRARKRRGGGSSNNKKWTLSQLLRDAEKLSDDDEDDLRMTSRFASRNHRQQPHRSLSQQRSPSSSRRDHSGARSGSSGALRRDDDHHHQPRRSASRGEQWDRERSGGHRSGDSASRTRSSSEHGGQSARQHRAEPHRNRRPDSSSRRFDGI